MIADASKTNREVLEQIIGENPDQVGKDIVTRANAAGVAKNRAEALLIGGARDGWPIATPGQRNTNLYRMRGPDDGKKCSFLTTWPLEGWSIRKLNF